MTELYKDNGRLLMAKSLERNWPGVATTIRRFQRPQHKIKGEWKYFDTPLIRRKDINWENLKSPVSFELTKIGDVKSKELNKYYNQQNGK